MKKLLTIATSAIAIAGIGHSANAVTFGPYNGSVEIVEDITVTPGANQLDFGLLTSPSASVDVTLDTANVINVPAGIQTLGGESRGEFTVSAQTGQNIIISASPAGADSGFSLSSMVLNYNSGGEVSGTTGAVAADSGGQPLYVGGTLTVPAGANSGNYTPTYNLDITYQ